MFVVTAIKLPFDDHIMATLRDKFRGCLIGAMIGDIAGAPVEAESPEYIDSVYCSIDDILAGLSVAEFIGPAWQVGRFTDDTQMMICVAEWLLDDASHSPERLLSKFADAYEPWRRYGSGTEAILRMYSEHKTEWRHLSTAIFPHGSHGNGSAMRVAPIGLAYFGDIKTTTAIAMESSRPTHSHSLAYQGAVLQSIAVATATGLADFDLDAFLRPMRAALAHFADLLQDTSKFAHPMDEIEQGIKHACRQMSSTLGTGVAACEAVPMALYCFLRHPDSYAKVIHEAVFNGGDTDTIASMAGAISGAFLGIEAIPSRWLGAVREKTHSVDAVKSLADRLLEKYA